MAELIWEGKYHAGQRIMPRSDSCSFQVVDLVDDMSARTQTDSMPAWQNRLIQGDKALVLPALLPEFAGKVKLVYIDPPFATGTEFMSLTALPAPPDAPPTWRPVTLTHVAYRDIWDGGHDAFLHWLYETLRLLYELLASNGCIFVHLDEHSVCEARLILDEIFGRERFLNDIIWYYADNFQGNVQRFASNHNTILVYAKSADARLNRVAIPLPKPVRRDIRVWDRAAGRVTAARDAHGRILYRDYTTKYADDVWSIGQSAVTKRQSREYLGYPTQKPVELLRRVIEAGSQPGDLVLDCFCGSGTTPAVAATLGRRWIAADQGHLAIHTTWKRLLAIEAAQPFVLQQLVGNEHQASVDVACSATVAAAQPALRLDVGVDGYAVRIALLDFSAATDALPALVRQAMMHWSQWIDYWAVDWYAETPVFQHRWRHYRTRHDPHLQTVATHRYALPGSYTVGVRVVDILGQTITRYVRVVAG